MSHHVFFGPGASMNFRRRGSLYSAYIDYYAKAYKTVPNSRKKVFIIENIVVPLVRAGACFWKKEEGTSSVVPMSPLVELDEVTKKIAQALRDRNRPRNQTQTKLRDDHMLVVEGLLKLKEGVIG